MATTLAACGGGTDEAHAPSPQVAEVSSALAIGGRCTAPSLASGDGHTCMVQPGGSVLCWGANASGQLGVATPALLTAPSEVPGVSGAVAVAAGASHTCALESDGTVTCWGSNTSGQLGDGTLSRSSGPVAVAGLSGVTSIAVGAAHGCALRNDGTVWCWGSNGSGRLGDGTTVRRPSPVRVRDLTDVQAITAGSTFTCAVTSSGVAYCWGANSTGQLGDGTRSSRLSPVEVHAGHGERWRSLAAGASHVCGVLQASGNEVRCWGSNATRQLGYATTLRYETTPGAVLEASGLAMTDAVMVAAAGSTSCAIRGDGRAVCWGANAQGQLGSGAISSTPLAPTEVRATAPLAGAFLLVSAGRSHTCALALSGEVYCWGANNVGQLGDGTRTRKTTPTLAGSNGALTFGAFAAEDDLSALHGASASSLVSAGDVLLAAGLERGAVDRWTVRRSRDRGANWAPLLTFEAEGAMQAPHLLRLPAGTLFLAGAAAADADTEWVVRRSADGGETWSDVDHFVFERGRAASLSALASDRVGRILTAGSADGSTGGHWLVRASADGGATWFLADDLVGEGATARAILDTTSGLFAVGHVVSGGTAHLRVRQTASIVEGDRSTTWTDADDFQDEAGFDTFGEAIASDLGGRIFVLARANGAGGQHLVVRTSTNGVGWRTASRFQVGSSDTEGYGLLVDRAGTLHVVGRAGGRGLIASSYDHGGTWVIAEHLGTDGALTALVEDPTGALHAAGSAGSGDAARWTVRSRACHGIAPSCGNWIIDPGELCDGNCASCDDHDACTTDTTAGSATTCDVVCTNTPISACTSDDGCCPAGCTSAEDLDCCTGPIENGACVDVSFEIRSLADDCTVLEHSPVNGTSRGALAVSSSSLFYTGLRGTRTTTGRFSAADLTGGRATSYGWSSLFSDLRTGTVYVLGSGAIASGGTSGQVSTLIPLDPATGALRQPRITLSRTIPLSAGRAFFSGYGRLLLYNGARLYDVQIPSGQVTDLGSMVLPPHDTCADRGTWGLAESFGGALYIDYAFGDEIRRTRVPGGATTTLATFSDLGQTCAIGFSTSARRWYFEASGASQFAPSGTATLGTCTATFRRPNATPSCDDGVLEGNETCDGDCPVSCDDGEACTADVQTGSAATCDIRCTHSAIVTCAHGDGCCVAGCNNASDDDCAPVCGNGVVEAGETCEGSCPASCDDGDACTADLLTGSAAACNAACVHAPITHCTGGDGCCPSGCSAAQDSDCAPIPVLASLAPSSVIAGSPATVVSLLGTGLIQGASVTFDGAPIDTTYVSDTELRVTIAGGTLASAGTHALRAQTAGGTTGALTFTVLNPEPQLTSVTPASVLRGAGLTLTLAGSGFNAATMVSFDDALGVRTWPSPQLSSATSLTVALSAAELATAGTGRLQVVSPSPGGGQSVARTIAIENPAPVISSLSPSSATAGAAATTLTVDGSAFMSGAQVTFAGTGLATTFVSASRLTAAIPSELLAAGGAFSVAVANPSPARSGAAASFTVTNPAITLTALTPSATLLGQAVTVTLTGTGFNASTTATFDGVATPATFVSATTLTIALQASQVASAGARNISVTSPAPGGGTAGPLVFTIEACPANYVLVSAFSGYTTQDFCIAKYQMKNVSGRATSQAALAPWNLPRGTDATSSGGAWKACRDLGPAFDLISNAQWQTVARAIEADPRNWSGNAIGSGRINSGNSDGSNGPSASSTDNDPYYSTGNTNADAWNGGTYVSGDEQKRTHVLPNGVIWDFSGNDWQWIKDNRTALGMNPVIVGGWQDFTGLSAANKALFGPSNSAWGGAQGLGGVYGHSANTAEGVERGGYWYWNHPTGIYSVILGADPTVGDGNVTFRCVYVPALYQAVALPATSIVEVSGTLTVRATAGLEPYSYSVASGGGTIDATTGVYTAPAAEGSAVLRVTDAAGVSATTAVSIVGRCPPGYVLVPPVAGYTTRAVCVAKYEMKAVSGAPASQAAGTPWTTLPRGANASAAGSAWKACRDLGTGFDLISNAQWQAVARTIEADPTNWSGNAVGSGRLNTGHSDWSGGYLAASTDSDPYFGTGNSNADAWNGGTYSTGDEQKRTHNLPTGVIWDFAGNAEEWVQDDWTSLGTSPTILGGWQDHTGLSATNRGLFGPTSAAYGGAMGMGSIYGYGGCASGIVRGGQTWTGHPGGVYTALLCADPVTTSGVDVAFRCVYDDSQYQPVTLAAAAATVGGATNLRAALGLPPYTFAVVSGGGSVSASGVYTAPAAAGSAVVRVTDARGRTADATVVIHAACPANFVLVPRLAGYTADDFCVAKYEMKNVGGVATSQAASAPWASPRGATATSNGGAWKACRDLGAAYDLVSNAEWQSIARAIEAGPTNWSGNTVGSGRVNTGHSDWSAGYLAASADNDPYFGTGNSNADAWNGGTYVSGDEQKRTHDLPAGVIWDLAGNMEEWVRDDWTNLGTSPTIVGGWQDLTGLSATNRSLFGPANATYGSGQGMGSAYGYTGCASGIVRGGQTWYGHPGGIFTTLACADPAVSNADVGFRCVYHF